MIILPGAKLRFVANGRSHQPIGGFAGDSIPVRIT